MIMNILWTPIKSLIEQLAVSIKQPHIADVGKMVESEELGIWAISEFNPAIKDLVEKNKKEAFNLMNK